MRMTARRGLAIALLLASAACGDTSDPGIDEVSLDELHQAAVAAGLSCNSLTDLGDIVEDDDSGLLEMGGCGLFPDDTTLMVYSDRESAVASASEGLGPPQLVGENWRISGDSTLDLAESLGGDLVPAKDGYAEARMCEHQARILLSAWAAGQQDTPESIAAALEANETGSPSVTIAPRVMSEDVAPNIPSLGAEAAIDVGMVAAATACRTHYISDYITESRTGTASEDPPTEPQQPGPSDNPGAAEAATCDETPDFATDALGCYAAQALAKVCDLDPPLRVAAWDKVGITEWESDDADQVTYAVTSQDVTTYEPTVLSCGNSENGVDVSQVFQDVWTSAEDGWGIDVMSVHCGSPDAGVLDSLPPGNAVASCTVNDANGGEGYAFISITTTAPYYRVDLGE